MSAEEREIYEIAMKEFYKLKDEYFRSTGNSRKDSALVILQQISMLMKISAAPNTLKEYTGERPPKYPK